MLINSTLIIAMFVYASVIHTGAQLLRHEQEKKGAKRTRDRGKTVERLLRL